jgi:hypothetical protein
MNARKTAKAKTAPKSKGAALPGARKPGAPSGRYDDEITPKTIDALDKVASDEEFEGFEPTSKAAW